ncbi:hypothetical protein Pint_20546 [Pistacia integerrima]|uniref:Uncharacterized protein n=1 Tax=Pistacia integerrima TaxID=434235 RepID=A0ACC0X8B6_9ROSI|nr:hypothetical protein Pint_20546 [Pistacia integerrima]
MSKNLAIDAWIREAQEAVKLVEDIETRVKNKSLKQEENQLRLRDDIARSKLFEVGVKLDRLESLLHNPPSKPILHVIVLCILICHLDSAAVLYRTNEDLEYRWKMLSDIQLRTKSLALCLYAMPSSNRSEGLPVADTKETNKKDGSYDHDQNKSSFAENEPELLKPLVSDDAPQSHMQITHCSSFIDSMPLFCKVCGIICSILGAVAFLFVLSWLSSVQFYKLHSQPIV